MTCMRHTENRNVWCNFLKIWLLNMRLITQVALWSKVAKGDGHADSDSGVWSQSRALHVLGSGLAVACLAFLATLGLVTPSSTNGQGQQHDGKLG
jgi:hypothetical protein